MSRNDEAVRSTNDDAASCKRSAVQLGYWSDPYVQFFTRASDRKPPEISRGYFARVRSIQGLILQFIEVIFLLYLIFSSR
jgi:[phosphatase 2A protein]-leucine-carboxy methyltransferase